ncbi:hypothetical protein TTHERM_000676921 (macronuclear) [Tetrahymena thermophila SB210]|uniref:Uncharacterized protein n=1 Tax=Tetrahymena thermophila (strain SB210) TaxID=312017 RepID=W7XDU8_TETTS|nr:hypothetical protein TTHERM_000676921 [Tetrahymena thermophila SB210]EWS70984.1 hypothetical protein TTHERM_000676921 [Tetrahymena thermophila SB210]|eukprot:XP_012656468.1 hypothetical protein TTHERM_000676921 [Tetrahymena thermophila SB210]
MNKRILYAFCSYINNQAYSLQKLSLKQRLQLFHKNAKQFTDKDKAALIMTLKSQEIIQQELAQAFAGNLNVKTIQHKELSVISHFLSVNQVQNQDLWKNLALRGFKIIEDFDRDSLPKFLDAIDRSEQVEIKQFWDSILQYALRNFEHLNGECALILFCNLARRYPSTQINFKSEAQNSQQVSNNQQNTILDLDHNQEKKLQEENGQYQNNEVEEYDEQEQVIANPQFDSITEKLKKSSQIFKEIESQKQILIKEDWEQQTSDIIFDIFNQIVKKHIKNYNGNQILRLMSYLISYREEWIQIQNKNNLKIAFVYLEEQIDTVDNLTFFMLTILQSLDKVIASSQFFIKAIDFIMKNQSQINHQNIHFICAFFEAIELRDKTKVWKIILDVLIKDYHKIKSQQNQQIIVSSLLSCNIVPTSLAKQNLTFDQLIQEITKNNK